MRIARRRLTALATLALVFSACSSAVVSSPAASAGSGVVSSPAASAGSGASPTTGASASAGPGASPSAVEKPLRVEPVGKTLTNKKIAVISFANNPFWEPVKAGTAKAKEVLAAKGVAVDYIVAGPQLDTPTLIAALDAAVTSKYDAIGVVSLASGTCPAQKAAVDAGVVVANFVAEGACSEESGSLFFHGQNATDAGAKAADAMAAAIGGSGKVAIITGSFVVEQHEQRRQGFEDRIKQQYPNITVLPAVENGDDAGKAQSLADDFMTANADLKGIYVTAGGPFGAAQAVKLAGKTGQVAVVSYDFVPETVQLVRDGVIVATIGQDPYGAAYNTAMWLFNNLADGSKPTPYFQPVNAQVMTKDNIEEVLASQQ